MKFDESGDSMNNFFDDVFSHEIKTPSTLPVSIAKGNLTNKEFVKFRVICQTNKFGSFYEIKLQFA